LWKCSANGSKKAHKVSGMVVTIKIFFIFLFLI
jgi:hypothetical protein